MQAQEIITQLQTVIPQLSDAFTKNVDVATVVRSGTVLTVQCGSVHGAKVEDIVSLVGCVTPISVTSIVRVDTLLTVVTADTHDLTYNSDVEDAPEFTIEGANESEFNATHMVNEVVNRNTLTVTVADSGAVAGSGTMTLLGGASHLQGYNLPYKVQSVPTLTSFTVAHPGTTLLDPRGDITARFSPRISGGATVDRVILAYTKRAAGEYYIQVVLEDVDASRDLKSQSDAVVNRNLSTSLRQQIQTPFSVYLFVPASDDLSGREARDAAQGLWKTMCRALVGKRFGSDLTDIEQGAVGFHSHGTQEDAPAFYVHRYSFIQMVDLTFGDTVGAPKSVAFRDIDFTMTMSTGDDTLSTPGIDLDDSPA